MPDTIAYYDSHAARYVADTVAVDMSGLHARFLAHVPDGGLILDAGCGSGRDSKAFMEGGYRVRAFDASRELAQRAAQLLGQAVEVRRFADFSEALCYDGIWACASLLHLPAAELPATFRRLWTGLKPGGALYLSFKHGDGERAEGGRHFTDATETRLREWLAGLDGIDAIDCWITQDQRPGREESWLNAIVRRTAHPTSRLITGDARHPFLPQLCGAIARADEIDLAVSFVKVTGLRLLLPDLHDALGQNEVRARPDARLRVLTSDYLDITDPEALRLLMLLQEQGAQVRVFEAAGRSFHMKAYLFAHFAADRDLQGTAKRF